MTQHDRAKEFVRSYTEILAQYEQDTRDGLITLGTLRASMEIAFVEGWAQRGKMDIHDQYKTLIEQTTGLRLEGWSTDKW